LTTLLTVALTNIDLKDLKITISYLLVEIKQIK